MSRCILKHAKKQEIMAHIWGWGKQSTESVLKEAQVLDLGFKPAPRHMFK